MEDEVIDEYVGGIYGDTYDIFIDHNQPIVRCRDCKEFSFGNTAPKTVDWCDYWCDCVDSPGGFCAWGERKVVGE